MVSGFDFNRGEHIIRSMVKVYPLIHEAFLQDDSGYLEVSIMGHGSGLFGFLFTHFGHDLELFNEYGSARSLLQPDAE